jgi:transcriptional regulator with XRE-family HTH domain
MERPAAAVRRAGRSPERAFGDVLRRLRKKRKLSQDELGHQSGYHRTYISQLERGEKSPSLRTIVNLASTLRVKPSTFLHAVERLI